MEFTEKKVLVFGTGISGVAAANLLENAGAEVVLFDGNEKLDKAHVLENFTESKTPELYVGVLPEEVEKELDLVVLSPGVPVDLPLVLRLKEAGLPIWGEIELAYRCKKGDVLAITGTNGKTTTTALLGEIMKTVCVSYFEHHTGSSEPSSYDGKLYCCKIKHCKKSGAGADLCTEL